LNFNITQQEEYIISDNNQLKKAYMVFNKRLTVNAKGISVRTIMATKEANTPKGTLLPPVIYDELMAYAKSKLEAHYSIVKIFNKPY
jgi:hypothetical protein